MPTILLTTPVNSYLLEARFETLDEILLPYPFVYIQNDSVYFRNSSNVLVLRDGVPISLPVEVSFLSIERIEIVAEDVGPLYGDYDGVVNLITKRFNGELAYSNIRLLKNPDHTQFEFGRSLFQGLGIYLTGDLNSNTKLSGNLEYESKYANLRCYLGKDFSFQAECKSTLLPYTKIYAKRDFFCTTQNFNLRNHKILAGIESKDKALHYFIQDYWEPYPLLYILPGLGYDGNFLPKVSFGFIPAINLIGFGSLTPKQLNLGVRWEELHRFGASINLSHTKAKAFDYDTRLEARLVTPWILDFRFSSAAGVDVYHPEQETYNPYTLIGEYRKEFKQGDIGIWIFGDSRSEVIRFEFQILDARFFYKLNSFEPSYGISWEFWD